LRRGVRGVFEALDFIDGVGRLVAKPFRLVAGLLDTLW
jgi:hypothetical protein